FFVPSSRLIATRSSKSFIALPFCVKTTRAAVHLCFSNEARNHDSRGRADNARRRLHLQCGALSRPFGNRALPDYRSDRRGPRSHIRGTLPIPKIVELIRSSLCLSCSFPVVLFPAPTRHRLEVRD